MRTSPTTVARVRICQFVTPDRILEVCDLLSLEPRRSRIAVSLSEVSAAAQVRRRVSHVAHASDFKLVCRDILHGTCAEWADEQGGDGVNDDGARASVLTLQRDTEAPRPFLLKIDNGVGEVTGRGAVKMVLATDSITLTIPQWDARRLAQTALDYIHDWETINFRQRQEAQTLIIGGAEAFP